MKLKDIKNRQQFIKHQLQIKDEPVTMILVTTQIKLYLRLNLLTKIQMTVDHILKGVFIFLITQEIQKKLNETKRI